MNIPNVVGVSSTRPSVRLSFVVVATPERRAYDIRILIDVLLHAPRSTMREGGKQADTAASERGRQPLSPSFSPPLPLRLHERRRGASE